MNTKVVGITFASTMLFATITSGLLLSSSPTYAADDSAVTVTEITVPSSCSMTANVSTPHVADIVNGNRAINIGKTTLSTFCNDPGGFAIYAIGYTNNELGATNVIATNNTDTIATGNTAPSNNSSWGMKVVNSASSQFPATITPYFNVATNDGYVAVPSTFTLMASRNSGTAMDSATLLDTTYGAYISPTQPVGEYNGQVLYTMVHPSSAAGPNAGTMFEAAFLMQPTPPTKKTVGSNSYYKMQDMTSGICTVMSIGAEGQMVDDRDDKIYWVLKAKDGKCWMTQNLDHDIVTTENFYTPQNTDVDTAWTALNATTSTIDSNGSFTGWTDSATVPSSANPGDWYWTDTYYTDTCSTSPNYCNYLSGNSNDKFATTPYSGNGTHGHVGNYYNYTASIAMNNSSNVTSGDASTSICPAGWRLPSRTNNEFTTLLTAYGIPTSSDEKLVAAPLYFVRSGYIYSGSQYVGGHVGYDWSSTTQSNQIASFLDFRYSGINAARSDNRMSGFSVRCIARTETKPTSINRAFYDANKTTVTIGNNKYYKMQDMSSSICSNVTVGQTGKLVDIRDNTVYIVGKLSDNRCWLLDNLAIDLVAVSLNTLKGNTNATDTELGYLKNGGGATDSRYSSGEVAYWTTGSTYVSPLMNITNKDIVPTTYNGTDDPMKNEAVAGNWKIGGYYNYCAASAGSYCYPQDGGVGNAAGDICPSNWRMPTGGTSGEYQALANAITGGTSSTLTGDNYTTYRRALHLPSSGYFYAGNAYYGNGGYYDASTYSEETHTGQKSDMHLLNFGTTVLYPATHHGRYIAFTVRCVAK